jgi:hypothetical protein
VFNLKQTEVFILLTLKDLARFYPPIKKRLGEEWSDL